MSKLLVIGAGWEQHALIKTIKDSGHTVVATHPSIDGEGFELADHFYVKESTDIEAHIRIAETHKIDGVVSDNCDYSFYTASVVALKLNLSFADLEAAIFSIDKYWQRTRMANLPEINQPNFFKVREFRYLKSAAKKLGFPLVVKPVDSRGTFGVTVVNQEDQLKKAFVDALHNSPSRTIICEEFIAGTLVTVDGFCFKNGHRSLGVASRKFESGPKPVTKEIIYPADFSQQLRKRLLANHEQVVEQLGYDYGHSHGEYIVTEDESIYLVECANRGAGVFTSSVLLPLMSEINLNEILLNQSLGVDDYKPGPKEHFMNKAMILTFLDFEVGKVIKDINFDEMRSQPYTVRFRSLFGENDMVEPVENCASRHTMILLQGNDMKEVSNNLEDFKQKLKVEYYHS